MKLSFFIIFIFVATAALGQVKFRSIEDQLQTAYQENDTIRLSLGILPLPDSIKGKPRFSIAKGYEIGMQLTSDGQFSWKPSYDFVNKNEKSKEKEVLFKVSMGQWGGDTLAVPIRINHTNRPPTVPQTPTVVWLFLPNQAVMHTFTNNIFKDEDGDEIAFRLIDSPLPGVTLSTDGQLRCSLSSVELKTLPSELDFEVFEISGSDKFTTQGKIILKKSNTNYPPIVKILPNTRKYSIQEEEKIEFRIEVKDPNEDSVMVMAYTDIPGSFAAQYFLEKINRSEYVLRWSPDYHFVPAEQPNREFMLTFEARDSRDSATKVEVTINVANKVNWVEIDSLRTGEYHQIMAMATDIFEQLENQLAQTSTDLLKKMKKKKFRAAVGSTFSALSKSPALRDALVNSISKKNENLGATIKEFANRPQEQQMPQQTPQNGGTPSAAEAEIVEINTHIQSLITDLQGLHKTGELFALHFQNSQERRKKEDFIKERDALFGIVNIILFQQKLQTNRQPIDNARISQKFLMYSLK